MKKIRIGFSSFPDYSGNSKALYEALKMKKLDQFELVWFVKDLDIKNKLDNKRIASYYDKDPQFLDEFNKTDIVFNTHDDYIKLKNKNQIFIGLWHGIGPKRGGCALGYEKVKNFVDTYSNACDYIVAPSEFSKLIFSNMFNKSANNILTYPQPRYEFLKRCNGKENLKRIVNLDLEKYKRIIMYTPTFRNGIGELNGKLNSNNLINLEEYDENKLIEFLKDNNYLLVLKLHPSEESNIKIIESDNIVLLKDKDMLDSFITINEILNCVDLLITDYSSIYIDYINLLRPVLFLNTDLKKYNEDRGLVFNGNNIWFPGPKINKIEDFILESKKLLTDENYYKGEREEFNNLVNESSDLSCDKFIDEFIMKIDKLKKEDEIFYYNKIKYDELKEEKEKFESEARRLKEKLDMIEYSRSYKFIKKLKKIIKK